MAQRRTGHGIDRGVSLQQNFKIFRNAPYVGMLTIWLNDYPMLKYAVIGLMFITVLVSKDPQS